MTPPTRLLAALLLALLGTGEARAAASCSASMTDVAFGTVTLRAGAANATTGTLRIDCAGGTPGVAVGACVTLGAGSGGAGGGQSPRYLRRADGAALPVELRAGGSGPAFGTWTAVHLTVPIGLDGRGAVAATVFGDVTGSGTAIGTGDYASTFAGATGGTLTFGVALCGLSGTTVAIPPFRVSATVASSCEADGASLSFGSIGTTVGAPVDAAATLAVRCTAGTAYRLRLSLGGGVGVTRPEARAMTGALGRLVYGLYRDSARSAPWGDAAGLDIGATGTGATQGFPVYGRIAAGQTVPAGPYADSVTVTIEY